MNNSLPDSFITSALGGRLGNLMFQIAHGYSQALTHNKKYLYPLIGSDVPHFKDSIFRNIDFFNGQIENLRDRNPSFLETTFHFTPIVPAENGITVFCGYYQSEKYFQNHKDKIKQLYSPTEEFKSRCFNDYPELQSNNATVINVRRGHDYLGQPENHPVVTEEFIYKALEHIPNKDHVYVVSDNMPWCRETLKIDNVKFVDYVGLDALWFLSLCKHFVISNSTFSWWGAYLGEKPDSVVVAPETWFGPGVHSRGHYETDIYQQNWIKLPTYWDNGEIKLKP